MTSLNNLQFEIEPLISDPLTPLDKLNHALTDLDEYTTFPEFKDLDESELSILEDLRKRLIERIQPGQNNLSNSSETQERLEESVTRFNKISTTFHSNEVAALMLEADRYFYSGKYLEAIQQYDRVLRIEPEYARARENFLEAKVHLENGDVPEVAIPGEAADYFGRAQSAERRAHYNEAINYIEQALNIVREQGILNWRAGAEFREKLRVYADAELVFEDGLEKLHSCNFEGALDCFRYTLMIHPRDVYKNKYDEVSNLIKQIVEVRQILQFNYNQKDSLIQANFLLNPIRNTYKQCSDLNELYWNLHGRLIDQVKAYLTCGSLEDANGLLELVGDLSEAPLQRVEVQLIREEIQRQSRAIQSIYRQIDGGHFDEARKFYFEFQSEYPLGDRGLPRIFQAIEKVMHLDQTWENLSSEEVEREIGEINQLISNTYHVEKLLFEISRILGLIRRRDSFLEEIQELNRALQQEEDLEEASVRVKGLLLTGNQFPNLLILVKQLQMDIQRARSLKTWLVEANNYLEAKAYPKAMGILNVLVGNGFGDYPQVQSLQQRVQLGLQQDAWDNTDKLLAELMDKVRKVYRQRLYETAKTILGHARNELSKLQETRLPYWTAEIDALQGEINTTDELFGKYTRARIQLMETQNDKKLDRMSEIVTLLDQVISHPCIASEVAEIQREARRIKDRALLDTILENKNWDAAKRMLRRTATLDSDIDGKATDQYQRIVVLENLEKLSRQITVHAWCWLTLTIIFSVALSAIFIHALIVALKGEITIAAVEVIAGLISTFLIRIFITQYNKANQRVDTELPTMMKEMSVASSKS